MAINNALPAVWAPKGQPGYFSSSPAKPRAEGAAASSRWAQNEVVLRGSDHLSETRDLSREEVTGKKRKKEKIF